MSARPWAEPGLSIEDRAGALTHAFTLQKRSMKLKRMDIAAEALRQTRADALDEAALELELLATQCFALESGENRLARDLAARLRTMKADAP